MDKLKVGIIGCGGIARNRHFPAWAKLSNVEIAAACDVNGDCIAKVAEDFGVKNVYTDFNEMLAENKLDAVDICTPNFLHNPPAIAALEAGAHVIIEKPIARTAKEAAEIVAAAKKNNRKLMVAQCQRFREDAVALKRFIDAGKLGDIYYARVQALRRRGVPSWGVFIDKEKQGGGPLIDIGVHMLDLTLWFMGHPKPVSVSGITYTKFGTKEGTFGVWGPWDYKNFTVEDFASAIVKFDNGASLVIETSFAANIEKEIFSTALLGTEGGADFSPLKMYSEEQGCLVDVTPVQLRPVDKYDSEIKAFAEAIINGTEVPVTGEQGMQVMQIIDAIYESSETGKEVRLD